MSNFIFSIVVFFLYSNSLAITAKDQMAYFQFYAPYAVIVLWLLLNLGTNTSGKFISTSFYAKLIFRFLNFLKFLLISFIIGIQGYVLYDLQNITNEISKPEKGLVLSVRENWLPFVREFKSTIVQIKLNDGKIGTFSGQSLERLWVGQEVILLDYKANEFYYHEIYPDDLGYNKKILEKYPFSKKPWENILNALLKTGDTKQLEDSYKSYLEQFGFDDFSQRFANDFWLNQNLKQATKLFKIAYEQEPSNYNILKYYGFYLLKTGNKEGEDILNKAIEINPQSFEAYYQLGIMLFEKSEMEKAYPILKKAIELNPNLSDVQSMIIKIEKMTK